MEVKKLYDQYEEAYDYYADKHYSSNDRAHQFALAAMLSTAIKGEEFEIESTIETYYGGTNPLD